MPHHDEICETIRRNSKMVYRLAFAQMKNQSDADDVYQDVFYRYIKKKPEFENAEHEKAWFIRVTLNCSRTSLKSFWKTKACELDEAFEAAEIEESNLIYAIGWVHNNLKIPAALVEYKSSSSISTQKDINMIKAIIKSNGKVPSDLSNSNFPLSVDWKNGSTAEPVYKVSNLSEKLDTLKANASAKCYGKAASSYIVVYNYGNGKHKAGFVKYAGGVKKAPAESKSYKNKASSQPVYADTAKKSKIGSLDPDEKCICLGKIDDMYLVVYKVTGTSKQKCGFVDYNGIY